MWVKTPQKGVFGHFLITVGTKLGVLEPSKMSQFEACAPLSVVVLVVAHSRNVCTWPLCWVRENRKSIRFQSWISFWSNSKTPWTFMRAQPLTQLRSKVPKMAKNTSLGGFNPHFLKYYTWWTNFEPNSCSECENISKTHSHFSLADLKLKFAEQCYVWLPKYNVLILAMLLKLKWNFRRLISLNWETKLLVLHPVSWLANIDLWLMGAPKYRISSSVYQTREPFLSESVSSTPWDKIKRRQMNILYPTKTHFPMFVFYFYYFYSYYFSKDIFP